VKIRQRRLSGVDEIVLNLYAKGMYSISLRGQLVTLREFRHDDIHDAFNVVGDDRVTTWLSFDSRNLEATAEMIIGATERARHEARTEYYLAVADDADALIGFARLGFAGVKAAKLRYAIRADRWGKGYATDACRTLIEFGFAELGLHRITAAIGPDNIASIAVARKLRMTHEGRLGHHVFTNGGWRDSELFAILESEARL
jgi:ribosomal-protein-alanine N-acetyltransferase